MVNRQREHEFDSGISDLSGLPANRAVALLHSGRFHRRWASRSILAEPRCWFRAWPDGRSELVGQPLPVAVELEHQTWRDLRRLLNHHQLPGRWIGYFSYDLAHLIEPAKLPRTKPPGPWPLIELGWCPDSRELDVTDGPVVIENAQPAGAHVQADFTPPQYEAAVGRVIEYIGQGDVFQVNLAQRFTASYAGSPRALFARLAAISPAWFGAYLELPDSRAILSTSPELFLQVDGREVLTRPIKGTRPAEMRADELRHSEKDTAELNMIVDLMRNDLGRVCEYGSIRVEEAREIESHPTVHHGVATIAGRLHERFDIVDLLKATLPGGSITGAPKVRAMQIIDELEPVARGPYCGCIGWISRDACQLNIAIRTMLVEPGGQVSFSVGGGIVADSEPAGEYQETLDKARAMLAALNRGGKMEA